jgi:Na+-translocating ferredoxin:NAD+ oxidoreductase RnfG subunit
MARLAVRAFSVFCAMAGCCGVASAALCVWLNPDRDIKAFFPGAGSYSTEVRRHNREQQADIEARTGGKLDPDENEFRFYRVRKGRQVVGTVLTHQARGRYGAVQVVVAIGNDRKVIGVYVQRHREPTNLNTDSFLKQFVGRTASDPIAIGKDVTAIKGHETSCAAVSLSVKKVLVVHEVLGT